MLLKQFLLHRCLQFSISKDHQKQNIRLSMIPKFGVKLKSNLTCYITATNE